MGWHYPGQEDTSGFRRPFSENQRSILPRKDTARCSSPLVAENFVSGQCVLQQDWAPAHSARSTLAFCESHFSDYWTKDFWPPNSPDLNPMDFAVWVYLQQKVSSKSHQSFNALKASHQMAWNDIDVTFLRPTVMSVEKRLKACIAAKGARFEHLLE
ncbi:unnamed protein product [Heligmosomoides polygyrus]|uniref:DDE_3 domain-containing protein n=1 Tax=Heligmosomoides polygyrus TaxID=6339 RepID=A0A183GD67_HELPZ|nr:unnamed protein product [Heligmosomoides polygyrus]